MSQHILKILLTLPLISCGLLPKEKDAPVDKIEQLQQKYEQVLLDTQALLQPPALWPSDTDCDGALWAGIARRAGLPSDVASALQSDGRPTRRPNQDCGPTSEGLAGDSAATTSNDMLLGIVLGLHAQKDLESLKLLWDYGFENNWIMGVPKTLLPRVLWRPTGYSLLAQAIYRLGGPDYSVRNTPSLILPVEKDYEEHLQALSVLLSKDLGKPIGSPYTCLIRKSDALIQAVCGEYNTAADLLLGDYKTPSYVRAGHLEHEAILKQVHWLIAAKVVLEN
jgi:hypothetical protein